MLLKIYDSCLQSYVFVNASIVYWNDGDLTVCVVDAQTGHFRCSRRVWRKIQFFMWAGSTYIDISKLRYLED